MYYDLEEKALIKYKDGQALYYTPSNPIWKDKPSIVIVERMKGYSAKLSGLPIIKEVDEHYIKVLISDTEVYPISEDSHPELLIKLGVRL